MSKFAFMSSHYELASELRSFDRRETDTHVHREDRFIAGFLTLLGSQPARTRRMAKLLAQEALDEVVDAEGYVDSDACAALDVAQLLARCSTLSAHRGVPPRERLLIRDAFAEYVRAPHGKASHVWSKRSDWRQAAA